MCDVVAVAAAVAKATWLRELARPREDASSTARSSAARNAAQRSAKKNRSVARARAHLHHRRRRKVLAGNELDPQPVVCVGLFVRVSTSTTVLTWVNGRETGERAFETRGGDITQLEGATARNRPPLRPFLASHALGAFGSNGHKIQPIIQHHPSSPLAALLVLDDRVELGIDLLEGAEGLGEDARHRAGVVAVGLDVGPVGHHFIDGLSSYLLDQEKGGKRACLERVN